MGLAQAYESVFAQNGLHTAQILLTHADLADRTRYLNARSTLVTLLELGVVPIINENDTVVTDEIKFGDNDTLGALVANLIDADALIILTDQQGLHRRPAQGPVRHPDRRGARREHRPRSHGRRRRQRHQQGRHDHQGARRPARRPQRRPHLHRQRPRGRRAAARHRGKQVGTLLYATSTPLAARKQWLADHLQLAGSLILDDGAVEALKSGKSLLPIGVTAVEGDFNRGAVVACRTRTAARSPAACQLRRQRRPPHRPPQLGEIENTLGYMEEPELIHRDNLVLIG
jgi:glutamate 5-kinase